MISKDHPDVIEHETNTIWMRTRISLLERIRGNRDNNAWIEFYQLYWRVIYKYALSFKLSPADAEDIVQETMLIIFKRLPLFQYDRLKGRFLSWIKVITKHRIFNLLRRRRARIKEVQLNHYDHENDSTDHVKVASVEKSKSIWDEEWEKSVLTIALEEIRKKLNPTTWDSFRLYVLEESSPESVAKALDISINSVYVNKNRVINLLKKQVAAIQTQI